MMERERNDWRGLNVTIFKGVVECDVEHGLVPWVYCALGFNTIGTAVPDGENNLGFLAIL